MDILPKVIGINWYGLDLYILKSPGNILGFFHRLLYFLINETQEPRKHAGLRCRNSVYTDPMGDHIVSHIGLPVGLGVGLGVVLTTISNVNLPFFDVKFLEQLRPHSNYNVEAKNKHVKLCQKKT